MGKEIRQVYEMRWRGARKIKDDIVFECVYDMKTFSATC